MTYRANQLRDIPIGNKFLGPSGHMYMRVKDITYLTKMYPGSVTVVNMDTHEVMILHEAYDVKELVEKEEIDYDESI